MLPSEVPMTVKPGRAIILSIAASTAKALASVTGIDLTVTTTLPVTTETMVASFTRSPTQSVNATRNSFRLVVSNEATSPFSLTTANTALRAMGAVGAMIGA